MQRGGLGRETSGKGRRSEEADLCLELQVSGWGRAGEEPRPGSHTPTAARHPGTGPNRLTQQHGVADGNEKRRAPGTAMEDA